MGMIEGTVTLPKGLLDADFLHDRPASPYEALVDLWRWANDRERRITLNGQGLTLKRGQLARSQGKLAECWQRDRKWVASILSRFQENGLIMFRGTPQSTLITVLDYEVYNPCTATVQEENQLGADSLSDNETDSVSDSQRDNLSGRQTDSETDTEEEEEEEVKEGEARARATPPRADEMPEVPGEDELALFCRAFVDLPRGIEGGIPEIWWRKWYAHMLSSKKSFRKWREVVKQNFIADWLNPGSPGYRLARANLTPCSTTQSGPENGQKKNGGGSVAQELFRIDMELREVQRRLDEAHELGVDTPEGLREKERALKAKRAVVAGNVRISDPAP